MRCSTARRWTAILDRRQTADRGHRGDVRLRNAGLRCQLAVLRIAFTNELISDGEKLVRWAAGLGRRNNIQCHVAEVSQGREAPRQKYFSSLSSIHSLSNRFKIFRQR